MDNKGRVTVVLHWDQRHGGGGGGVSGGGLGSSKLGDGICIGSSNGLSPSKKNLSAQNSIDKSGVGGGGSPLPGQRYPSPQITVINHDDPKGVYHSNNGSLRRMSKSSGGSSFDNSGIGVVHVHTPECAHHAHTPSRAGSPSAAECDFHCCALHEEGRKIAVHKSVATSPIQDNGNGGSPQPGSLLGGLSHHPSSMSDTSRRSSSATNKGHVRFLDIGPERDSSESETENTVMEDESVTSEKFLLLIDQLSVDQKRHLSIKDIGIILERLSSKILDVERLDRESESDDCYNWTIKATIRGDALRELGVIYNGNYYAISEHPGYKEENEENCDDEGCEEEELEDEDRL